MGWPVKMSTPAKPVPGNPASAKPMGGLSERAQKELTRKRNGFGVAIAPAGDGLARQHKLKARI